MARQVIETIYGKYSKFEIVRDSSGGPFFGTVFYLYRDGKYYKGHYSDLRDAVAAARREG